MRDFSFVVDVRNKSTDGDIRTLLVDVRDCENEIEARRCLIGKYMVKYDGVISIRRVDHANSDT